MNEYSISDYGIFSDAIKTNDNIINKFNTGKNDIETAKTTINNDGVFMGPIADKCRNDINEVTVELDVVNENFATVKAYLAEVASTYKSSDDKAKDVLNLKNSTQFGNNKNFNSQPNFTNNDAYGSGNGLTNDGWTGECSWFSAGKYCEMYGQQPNLDPAHRLGKEMASEIVRLNEGFELSTDKPKAGAVFSCPQGPHATQAVGHTGVVTAVDGNMVTIQEGNVSGMQNTQYATVNGKTVSYIERTMTIDELKAWYPGINFANPKD